MSKGRDPGPTPDDSPVWRRLHLWQIQPVRDVLLLLAICGLIWLGYVLRPVTAPILFALALAYLFEPLVCRLSRIRWLNRHMAAIAIILMVALALVVPLTLAVSFGVVQGVQAAEGLTRHLVTLRHSVDEPENQEYLEELPPGAWRRTRDYFISIDQRQKSREDGVSEGSEPEAQAAGPLSETELAFEPLVRSAAMWALSWLRENSDSITTTVGKRALGAGLGAVKGVIGIVTTVGYFAFAVFLTAFFFFFFSSSFGRVVDFWHSLIPTGKRERVVYLVRRMDRVIAAFLRGRLTIALILSGVYTIGYWAIGVPAPFFFGPIVGLISLAPFLSGLVGMPVAMILMLLYPSDLQWQTTWWWIIFAPIGVSMIGQALDDYVLTPLIQGKGTDMDMPTILFASIAGGILAGFYGILLAIPVAACVKILLIEVMWPKFKDWSEGRSRDPLPISSTPEVKGDTP